MTLTSRSPYTVSASVRGIGVAVITSTSGCEPFHQLLPLLHAEAMLLVDDRQAQPLEFDIRFQQRVRADHHMHQPCRDQLLQLHLIACGDDPVSRIVT